MFTGLSAFPLTPFKDQRFDPIVFERLITNLVEAQVDSICAMGSTGLYPYLSTDEKSQVIQQAVSLSGNIPVMVGIGALRTTDVLRNAEQAQAMGASAVLLAPVSYHALTEEEVFSLYEAVTHAISVPLCIYDNPFVTQFSFSNELYREVTRLPNVGALKIPGTVFGTDEGKQRLAQLRSIVPESVAVGVSGDAFGAAGMAAGCDLWLSVIGGLFPKTTQRLMCMSNTESLADEPNQSEAWNALWALFAHHRGLRVMATAADLLGYCEGECLPAPLKSLQGDARQSLASILNTLPLD